jgi:hypothetical protein
VQSSGAKSTNNVPVWNGSAWVFQALATAQLPDDGVTVAKLAHGTARQFLAMNSTDPAWISGGIQVISDTTLGAGAASIDITSIPADFKSLKLILTGRGDTASTSIAVTMRLNNDSGGNYDYQYDQGSGATANAGEAQAQTSGQIGGLSAASAPANVAGAITVELPDYAGTTFQKSYIGIGGYKTSTAAGAIASTRWFGAWRNTAAISRITILASSGNFIVGTRATLYGIG